jgi:hypothetical protein
MEDIVVNGDKNSAEPVLAVIDGVLKQAHEPRRRRGGRAISKNLLRDLLKTLPSEYLRDKKQMVFLTSVDADLDYRNTLAERATAVRRQVPRGRRAGPLLGRAGAADPAVPREPRRGQNDRSVILLCNPKNIHVGIWRKIRSSRSETSRRAR